MMEQTIQHREGNGAVIVKGFRSVLECTVCGEHDEAFFIAVTDDLKQTIGADLVLVQLVPIRYKIGTNSTHNQHQ